MTKNPNAKLFMEFVEENNISLYKIARLSGLSDGTLRAFRDTPGRVLSMNVAVKVSRALHKLTGKHLDALYVFGGEEKIFDQFDSFSIPTLSKKNSSDDVRKKYGNNIADSHAEIISEEILRNDLEHLKTSAPLVFDFPVLSTRPSRRQGEIIISQNPSELILRPPGLLNEPSAFAIYVVNDQMAPRLEIGDIVYVHPTWPATRGSDVLVRLVDDGSDRQSAIIARRMSDDIYSTTFRQYNPMSDFTIQPERIRDVCKILNTHEFMTLYGRQYL